MILIMKEKRKKQKSIFVLGQLGANGKIENITIELIGKGRELANVGNRELCVVLLGEEKQILEAGKKLLHYHTDRIVLLTSDLLETYSCELYASVFANFLREEEAEVVLIGGTSFGREYAPRIAVLLDTELVTDAIDISIKEKSLQDKNQEKILKIQVIRPSFDGTMYSVFEYLGKQIQMVTVRSGVLRKASYEEKRRGYIQLIHVKLPNEQASQKIGRHAIFMEKIESKGREYHLEHASMVVAGGRGMKGKEGFKQLEELASYLGKGAEVASTRPCVDIGWTVQAQQVGQTGITIKPDLYMAFGISGAIQHITGFSEAKHIVGINTNPKASIFRYCDVGIVGDAEKVVKALIQELRKREAYTK